MPGRIAAKFVRAATLKPVDWLYLAIAVRELGLARVRHASRPVSEILAQLKSAPRSRADSPFGSAGAAHVARLAWALGAAGAVVPWRSDCLLRVMAADRWLRRWGAVPEFYLGVKKDGNGALEAHAWLRCGGLTVTGGQSVDFTPLMGTISGAGPEPARRP